MKEELYLWIRNLAVFYIFFTAVLNLIPDQKYEKYVRFFMGLLLIFMMSTPIFSISWKRFGTDGKVFWIIFLKKTERKNSGNFRIFRKSIWKKVTNWNWNRKSGKL